MTLESNLDKGSCYHAGLELASDKLRPFLIES